MSLFERYVRAIKFYDPFVAAIVLLLVNNDILS